MNMEAVLREAQQDFEDLTQRTLQRLRLAAERDMEETKAELGRREQALLLREARLLEESALATPTPARSGHDALAKRSPVNLEAELIGAAPGAVAIGTAS